MNLEIMRDLFRRFMQEEDPDQFEDNIIVDRYLNLGLQELQKKITAVDPDAVYFIDRADVAAGNEYYEQPAGCWSVVDVRVKDAATGGYRSLGQPIAYSETLGRADPEMAWARFGRHIVLSPVPSENVAAGIELVWVPTVTVAAASDVPILHHALHLAAVIYAQKLAHGETGESSTGVDQDLAPIINTIPQFYQPTLRPQPFRVEGIVR